MEGGRDRGGDGLGDDPPLPANKQLQATSEKSMTDTGTAARISTAVIAAPKETSEDGAPTVAVDRLGKTQPGASSAKVIVTYVTTPAKAAQDPTSEQQAMAEEGAILDPEMRKMLENEEAILVIMKNLVTLCVGNFAHEYRLQLPNFLNMPTTTRWESTLAGIAVNILPFVSRYLKNTCATRSNHSFLKAECKKLRFMLPVPVNRPKFVVAVIKDASNILSALITLLSCYESMMVERDTTNVDQLLFLCGELERNVGDIRTDPDAVLTQLSEMVLVNLKVVRSLIACQAYLLQLNYKECVVALSTIKVSAPQFASFFKQPPPLLRRIDRIITHMTARCKLLFDSKYLLPAPSVAFTQLRFDHKDCYLRNWANFREHYGLDCVMITAAPRQCGVDVSLFDYRHPILEQKPLTGLKSLPVLYAVPSKDVTVHVEVLFNFFFQRGDLSIGQGIRIPYEDREYTVLRFMPSLIAVYINDKKAAKRLAKENVQAAFKLICNSFSRAFTGQLTKHCTFASIPKQGHAT